MEERGCRLWLVTQLREPTSQARSSIRFNDVEASALDAFVAQHQSEQTAYLLFNHLPYYKEKGRQWGRKPVKWTKTGLKLVFDINTYTRYLSAASKLLKQFDVVGRTDRMAAFVWRLEELSAGRTGPRSHA